MWLSASSIPPTNAMCCRWVIGVMHFKNIWVLCFFKLLVITDITYNGSIDNQTSVHLIYFCIWCCVSKCWPWKGGWRCLMSPPCLESQGCHLIPLFYLVFVFLPSSRTLSVLSFFVCLILPFHFSLFFCNLVLINQMEWSSIPAHPNLCALLTQG